MIKKNSARSTNIHYFSFVSSFIYFCPPAYSTMPDFILLFGLQNHPGGLFLALALAETPDMSGLTLSYLLL